MIINKEAWHYRWYSYWLTHGRGNRSRYRENLCHYVRVLLFWAPATWLDQTWNLAAKAKRVGLGLFLLYVFGISGFALALTAINHPYQLLLAVGSLVGLLATTGLCYLYVRLGGLQATLRLVDVPGMGYITVGYILAKKRRICPFLTFEE